MNNRNMKFFVINPPPWFPNMPYLSVPLLTGMLKKRNISVVQRDINVFFFRNLLTSKELVFQIRERKRIKKKATKKEELLFELENYFADNVEKHLKTIKCETNLNLLNDLFSELDLMLKVFSLNYPDIELSLGKIYFKKDPSSDYVNYITSNNFFNYYISKYEIDILKKKEPDIIAFSITTFEQLIFSLTYIIVVRKKIKREIKFLFGGNYITKCYHNEGKLDMCLDLVDFIIIEDFESSIDFFISALQGEIDFSLVPNLFCKNDINGNKNLPQIIKNTSISKALPDFEGIEFDKYFLNKTILPYELSRGCYWGQCKFCEVCVKKYAEKTPANIVLDIKFLSKKYNVQYFSFVSSSPSPLLLRKVAVLLKNENIKWISFLRPESYIDKEFANDLFNGGCRFVLVGIESPIQRILDEMNKGLNVCETLKVLNNLKASGIHIHAYFMLNFTKETNKDKEKIRSYFSDNQKLFDSVSFTSFVNKDHAYKANISSNTKLSSFENILNSIHTTVKTDENYFNLNLLILNKLQYEQF